MKVSRDGDRERFGRRERRPAPPPSVELEDGVRQGSHRLKWERDDVSEDIEGAGENAAAATAA